MAYSTYATILHTVLQAFILTHEANLSKLDDEPAQTFNKVLAWSDRILYMDVFLYTGVGWLVGIHQLYQAMVGAKPHTGCLPLTTTRPDSSAIGILCTVYSS